MYGGDKIIESGVTYKVGNTTVASVNTNGVVTINKSNLGEVTEIECIATYNKVNYKKTFHIVRTDNAYDIVSNKVVLEKNSETLYLVDSDKVLSIKAKK
jgi:hypothetical protein